MVRLSRSQYRAPLQWMAMQSVGQLVDDLVGRMVVGLELRPQVGARLQQVELDLVDDRHGVLGRAADRARRRSTAHICGRNRTATPAR